MATTALTAAAALALAGCGGESGAETMTEEIIERASEAGGDQSDVEVDVQEDGDSESVTATSDEGEVAMSSGQDYPEDRPAGVPQPELDIESAMSTGGGDFTVISISGTTDAAPEEVLDTFRDSMDGWDIGSESSQSQEGYTLDGVRFHQGEDADDPDRIFNVTAMVKSSAEATQVELNYQQYRAS